MGKWMSAAAAAVAALLSCHASGDTDPNAKIDLIMVASDAPVAVGEQFEIPIMASAQDQPQRYVVSDIVFGWNPSQVRFDGISHEGSHPLLWREFSGLPTNNGDFNGINEVMPPADGTGLYYGYNILGSVWIVTEPVQLVRLKFTVISQFTETAVTILPNATGIGTHDTVVYGSYIAGLPVTGNTYGATVIGVSPPEGDINGDMIVDSGDLAIVLASWGAVSFGNNPADIDGDGTVGSGDLAILLANWN
jgi:hypothetical protein